MSIFSFIGHLFATLFGATKTAWEKAPQAVKDAMLNGQGILNIINHATGVKPSDVITTIQAAYPGVPLDLLYSGLSKVAQGYNLTVPASLPDLITVIQTHLKSLDEGIWPAIIQGAANVLSLVFAPESTPFEVIATLAQWAFTNLVRHNDVVIVTAAVADGKTVLPAPTLPPDAQVPAKG